jgi:feruloyl esterase
MVPECFIVADVSATSVFDMLTPLTKWVELDIAPERIPAMRVINDKVVRTRPLCPYPQTARYKGSGSIDEAVNFTCAAPK